MGVTSRCKQCQTGMHAETIGGVSGEDGLLRISISDFPVLVCERGHRHFMTPDFPIRLLRHVADEDEAKLPAGNKKGLVFKEYLCGECGGKLEQQAASKPFGFDVELDDSPRFRVELSVPVYKCAACGREQLRDRRELQQLTPSALAQGFQAAGLKPEA